MAQKRMFDKSLIDSDLFIDLPIPSQCLYFHLSMRADDEGFVSNVKGILRLVGFKEEDLRPLVDKQFILLFESGIIVIKHWRLNNYLRTDRFKETIHKKEKSQLISVETAENNSVYELGIPDGNQWYTQSRVEESRIDKNRLEENKKENFIKEKKYGEFKNVTLNDEELKKLKDRFEDYETKIENLSSYKKSKGKHYKSDYATILTWARKEEQNKTETFAEKLERIANNCEKE